MIQKDRTREIYSQGEFVSRVMFLIVLWLKVEAYTSYFLLHLVLDAVKRGYFRYFSIFWNFNAYGAFFDSL